MPLTVIFRTQILKLQASTLSSIPTSPFRLTNRVLTTPQLEAMLSRSSSKSTSPRVRKEQNRMWKVCFYSQSCSLSEIHGLNQSLNASLRLTMIRSVYLVSSQRRDRPPRSNQSPREAFSSSMEDTQRPHVSVCKALSTWMSLSHEDSSKTRMRTKNSPSWNLKWSSKMKSMSFHPWNLSTTLMTH